MTGNSDRVPDWLDRDVFPFESKFVDVDSNRVHYIDEGTGPTLVFLHGNPTWSFLYRHLVRRLSSRFRCIALDYPGFGLSRAKPGYRFTPREHSAVLEGFIDALRLSDLSIVVQDWGGPIGLCLAGRRPDLIRNIVIGNTFAWPAGGGMIGFSLVVGNHFSKYLITRRNMLAKWLIPAGITRELSDAEMAAYMGPFPTPTSRLPMWIFARQIRLSRTYLAEVERGLGNLSDKPALIVWGEADGAFSIADRDRLATHFPNNRIVNLEGAKHFIQEDAPDEIANAIIDWWPAS